MRELVAPTLALAAEHATHADSQRRPSNEVMRSLADDGLMRLIVPRSYGGESAHPANFIEYTAALGEVHGSLAWTAMTCNEEAGLVAAYLEPESVQRLYAEDPRVPAFCEPVSRSNPP